MKKIYLIFILVILFSSFGYGLSLSKLDYYFSFDNGTRTDLYYPIFLNKTTSGFFINNSINPGILRQAVNLNPAIPQSMDMNRTTNISANLGSYTINLWVKPNDTTSIQWVFVSNATTTNIDYEAAIMLYSGVYVATVDGTNNQIGSKPVVNSWTMLTLVKNESYYALYINGTLDQSSSTFNVAFMNHTKRFRLGMRNPTNTKYYNGSIDELSFWERKLTDAEISELYNSGLSTISFLSSSDNCSTSLSVLPGLAINYTFFYEDNLTSLNGDATGTLNWNIHGDSTTHTVYLSANNQPYFSQCFYPNYLSFDTTYNINYNGYGSSSIRTNSGSALLDYVTTTVQLYVLGDSSTTIQMRVRAQDAYSNPISGATITVTRTIAGIPYTVSTVSTDSAGMAYIYVDSTAQYSLQGSKTGYSTSDELTITPTNTDTYALTLGSQTTQQYSYATGTSYSFSPKNTEYLINNTSYNFVFNLSSSYWNISQCNISLEDISGNLLAISTGTSNGSNCNALVNYLTPNLSMIITSIGSYTINGTYIEQAYQYTLSNQTAEDFTIKTVIDDINNFSGAGFDWRSRMFIALCAIVGITAFLCKKFNALINPEAAMLIQFALVLIFTLFGWLEIPTTVYVFPTIGGYNMGHSAILILDFFATLAFFLWRL